MSYKMLCSPYLFWPKSRAGDSTTYQAARKFIMDKHGEMPLVISDDFDMAEFFKNSPDTILYHPVFSGSSGWWGELLGGTAKVCEKITLSKECTLIAIAKELKNDTKDNLFAAEIFPTSGFFKKAASFGVSISDMLATESGTVLALFSGKSQSKFQNFIESSGNFYLGCVGGY